MFGHHRYEEWFEVAHVIGTNKSVFVRTCSCCHKEQLKTRMLVAKKAPHALQNEQHELAVAAS
jgi:cytochrome c5